MSRLIPPVPTEVRLRGPLAESPSFVLMQAGRLALEWSVEALGVFELTLHQFAALLLISRLNGITQIGIVERLGISKAAVSGLVSELERSGLVERRRRLFNARERALYVTRAGAELVAEAADELGAIDAQFVERVGEDAITALSELPPAVLSPLETALRAAGLATPA